MAVCLNACSGDDPAACEPVNADCTPEYEPTFTNVYSQTLVGCGVGGSACHAPEGAQGGFVVSDQASTLASLMEQATTRPESRVRAGDVCSPLLSRIRGEPPAQVMPPGSSLTPAQICAVQKWVEAGANP